MTLTTMQKRPLPPLPKQADTKQRVHTTEWVTKADLNNDTLTCLTCMKKDTLMMRSWADDAFLCR